MGTAKRRIFSCAMMFASLVSFSGSSSAEPTVGDFTDFEQVSAKRISRVVTEFTYRAFITNDTPAVENVTATVSSSTPNTIVTDESLAFGSIAAGGNALSLDTFTFRHDRRFPFDPTALQFAFQFDPIASNTAPTPDAGPDQTARVTDSVTLDGSNSVDADGDPLTFSWSFVSLPTGSVARLDDPSSVTPTFLVDLPGTYVVQLIVNDGTEDSFPDTVTITTTNSPPVADAGPDQSVLFGDSVTLDGGGSTDVDGDPLTFSWSLTSVPLGSLAVLSDPFAIMPTFDVDVSGTYVAQLVVNDGTVDSLPDTVTITTGNTPPVADAGADQSVFVGDTVTLDATGSSDVDGDPLSFSWSLTSVPLGSTATLSDSTTANPTFVVDLPGDYVAQLIVDDGLASSPPDTVAISTLNSAPLADAGPDQDVFLNDLVLLDGGASRDADGDPLSFSWSILAKPAGSVAVLSNNAVIAPDFTADLPGIYLIQLIVSDGTVDSLPDTVTVNATNRLPIADAGVGRSVPLGIEVTLDGTGSDDPDGSPLTFSWTLTQRPAGSLATLFAASTANPRFTPDLPGTYVASLTVNDGFADSLPDTTSVVAVRLNQVPVADAGPDQLVDTGQIVALDGGNSSDGDGDPLTFIWTFTAVPAGSVAALGDPTSPTPTFLPDLPGDYLVQLIVNDGQDDSAPDSVTITAQAPVIVNRPPVLDPVGDQSVPLGSTLNLALTALDPDGDPITFGASPLPLPAGANLDAATGLFTFTPGASQAGSLQVTFTASDGVLSDSETVTVTVPAPQPGALTSVAGRLLDANAAASGQTVPIVGATVSLLGTAFVATSGADGTFLISGIAAGVTPVVDVDARSAALAPNGSPYGSFREIFNLIDGAANQITRPIFLPRVDPAGVATVVPGQDTTVTNANIGASMFVPADTALLNGLPFTGAISISEVPVNQAPVALPDTIDPAILVTIQPVGLEFTTPAAVTFPNLDGSPPGTRLDIYSVNPDTGLFEVVGQGEVSANGNTIETISGGIRIASWHAPVQRGANLAQSPQAGTPGNKDMSRCVKGCTGSETAVDTGNLREAHRFAGYRSFGAERSSTLIYNSTSADPRPVVRFDGTLQAISTIPERLLTTIEVAGLMQPGITRTSTALAADPNDPGLSDNLDETVTQAIQFDAAAFPTGQYPYTVSLLSEFPISSITTRLDGTVLVHNESQSPFGAGWLLSGLESLNTQGGAAVVHSSGDGSVAAFSRTGGGLLGQPNLFGPFTTNTVGIVPSTFVVEDVDNDGLLDLVVPYTTNGEDIRVLLGDGTGRFPRTRQIPSSGDTRTVAIGDFNRDGLKDVASISVNVTTQATLGLVVHFGSGGGFFDTSSLIASFPIFSFISGLTVGDVNGDGIEDIIAAGTATSTVPDLLIFLGDGQGSFASPQTVPLSNNFAADVFAEDLNDDGKLDLIVHNSTRTVSVLINTTPPGATVAAFQVQDLTTQGAIGSTVVEGVTLSVVDLNQDGNKDLVIPNSSLGFEVFFADSPGQMNPSSLQVAAGSTIVFIGSVGHGDFDRNGTEDIVFSGFELNGLVLRSVVGLALNDGTGDFGAPALFPSGQPVINVALLGAPIRVKDIDRDGLLDVIAASPVAASVPGTPSDPSLSLLFGTGTGQFRSPPGEFSALVENPNGTFTRTLKNGTLSEFDSQGRLTSRVDLNGNTTLYSYDGGGRLASITDPAGLVTTFAYSGGLLESVTDPAQRTTSFLHDADGNLTRITDPDGSLRQFAYDSRHRLVSQSSKRQEVTTYEYNAAGRQVRALRADGTDRRIDPAEVIGLDDGSGSDLPFLRPGVIESRFVDGNGNATRYVTGPLGAPTLVTDAEGRVTAFDRDGDGNPLRTTLPDGTVTETRFDRRGNPTQITEAVSTPLERVFLFAYDPLTSQPTRITDPAGNATAINYDAQGNPEEIVDAAGTRTLFAYADANCPGEPTSITRAAGLPEESVIQFVYDPATCNRTRLTDAEGHVTSLGYDTAGNLVTLTEGVGSAAERSTTFAYDALNRLRTVTDGEGNQTTLRYDTAGNLVETESPTGEIQFRTYDSLDRLESMDDPVTGLTTFTYDDQGNLKTVTDAEGAVTTFFYDAVDRVVRSLDAEGGERLLAYDLRDNLTDVTDARGNTTVFAYDLLDRVTRRTNPLGAFRQFSYDSRDNLTGLIDAKGQQSDFTYDDLSRLLAIETPDNTIQLTYDALSNATSVTDDDSALNFTYDGLDRAVTIATDASGIQPPVTLTSTYDPAGNRTALADSLGGTTLFGFDRAGRMDGVTTASGQPISLAYDAASRFSAIAFPNEVASEFAYDTRGRLEELKFTGNLGASVLESLAYQYNDVGSITQIAELTKTRNFTYDLLQQVTGGGTAAAPEVYDYDPEGNRVSSHLSAFHDSDDNNRLLENDRFTFDYDDNGNLITKTEKVGGAVTSYAYDAQDQLIRIDLPGGGVAQYRYDGLGRRIEKDVDSTITRYLYDGEDILLAFNGTNGLQARYTHGPGRDQPLSLERGGADFYYQADHLGSVRRLTNGSGLTVNSYDYDSFGRLDALSEAVPQPYTYTGRERDPESGLLYYRARYYDPEIGRFIQEDPIRFESGDYNLYRYIFNDTLNVRDPNGTKVSGKNGIREFLDFLDDLERNLSLVDGDLAFRRVITLPDGSKRTVFEMIFDRDRSGNCFGFVITGRTDVRLPELNEDILIRSGFTITTSDPKPGDIAIYRDARGVIVHAEIVIGVDSEKGTITVRGTSPGNEVVTTVLEIREGVIKDPRKVPGVDVPDIQIVSRP